MAVYGAVGLVLSLWVVVTPRLPCCFIHFLFLFCSCLFFVGRQSHPGSELQHLSHVCARSAVLYFIYERRVRIVPSDHVVWELGACRVRPWRFACSVSYLIHLCVCCCLLLRSNSNAYSLVLLYVRRVLTCVSACLFVCLFVRRTGKVWMADRGALVLQLFIVGVFLWGGSLIAYVQRYTVTVITAFWYFHRYVVLSVGSFACFIPRLLLCHAFPKPISLPGCVCVRICVYVCARAIETIAA